VVERFRRVNVAVVVLLVCAGGASAAQVARLPHTRPGQYLAEYLQACNSPNEVALAGFASNHLPKDNLRGTPATEWAHLKRRECEESGGYAVRAIESSSPNRLTVLLSTGATERWFRVELVVAGKPPYRIASFHYFPRNIPESSEARGMSDQQVLAELRAYLNKLVASGQFWGVVLVAKDDNPIFEQAYGMADLSKKRPNAVDSVFTIASMGKMFTAVSVAQLVELGKLSYQDWVGKFFPNYPNQQVRDRVTVGELLTHTSGLGDFLGRRNGPVQRAVDYLPLFENDPPQFEPGTRWSYSNAGFALAGAIVEKVSGVSYFDYVRQHVFGPAGMLTSDPNESGCVPPLMVTPYVRREGGGRDELQPAARDVGSPAGGAYSTATDLLRFGQALRTDKLMLHATFEELVAPHPPFKTYRGTDYGYGFETWAASSGRRVVGHGGGTAGVDTEFDLYLEQGYTVIVLSNYDADSDSPKTIAAKLRAMILRE
jgi:CubicO group peptidase (beta-lactamase class C family)